MKLLYLRGHFSKNPGGGLYGRALVRHLALESDTAVRTYVVPEDSPHKPDGLDFVSADDLALYDAVVMERGWNDPRDVARFPGDLARDYVHAGGILMVLDLERNAAARQTGALHEAAPLFSAAPDLRDDRVPYLHDEGAREQSGAYRFFSTEMLFIADAVRPAYDGVDSLLVAAPVMITTWGDIAASGHRSTRVLVDDVFVDQPVLTPWASFNPTGQGVGILVAAGLSADELIEACPDNARWLSNLLHVAQNHVRENRQWRGESGRAVERQTDVEVLDVELLLSMDEDRHLERKSSFLTTVPGGKREDYLKKAVLKSIAGLLNADGGHLILGQADDGTVIGLAPDFAVLAPKARDRDGFQRALQDSASSTLGQWVNLPLSLRWHAIGSRDVLVVSCRPSSRPIWLGDEFFVRQENSTVQLKGRDLALYLRERFEPHSL